MISSKVNYFLQRSRLYALVTILSIISGCGIETDNNVPGVPSTGKFAAVGANQHSGEGSIQVAIAIFDNGTPINLVGGDVVQASTTNNKVLLLESGFYKGSYAASLANSENFNQVDFLMVHKPIEARQARWYPVDLLNIDPGPGELVGASASIDLPPEPTNIALSGALFTNISDNFVMSWTPAGAGDIIKIRSAVSCDDGTKTITYGTEVNLTDETDDGTETINLNTLIYDIFDSSPVLKFINDEARSMLQETLEKLSNGGINDDYFKTLFPLNPVENPCEIRLFIFRQRTGSFDSVSTNGRIFGSRSAEVTINYNPN